MPIAAAVPFIIGAGTSVAGGLIGSHAAGKAADAQVAAAEQAAALQHQDAQAALEFQKQQYGNSLSMMAPYYGMGTNALNRLGFLMGMKPQNVPFDPSNPNPMQAPPANNHGGWSGPTNINDLPGRGRGGFDGGFSPNAMGMTNIDGSTVGGNMGRLNTWMNPAAPGGAAQMSTGVSEGFTQGSLPGQDFGVQPGDFGLGGGISGNPRDGTSGGAMTINANGGGAIGFQPDGTAGGFENRTGPPPPGQGAGGGGNDGFGSLAQGFNEQFGAPGMAGMMSDPGYQFRLNQGMNALQNSAASRGGLLTGGTAKAMNDYVQGSASDEYDKVYGRRLNEYLNKFNINRANQTDLYNRWANMAGLGQTSANQIMNAGANMANNASNILMTSGQQIGQNINNAGAARGSGYVGSGNAISGAMSGIGNLAQLYAILHKDN